MVLIQQTVKQKVLLQFISFRLINNYQASLSYNLLVNIFFNIRD